MSTAIKIENISKIYQLGLVGSQTLKSDVSTFFNNLMGKNTKKIASQNSLSDVDSDWVWALQNVSFEVKEGEILGIIGKNGAGKSTLLKILSKITAPSEGKIHIKGRMASLLEVGTGFHGELTGRENIFLNGAILGMTKAEITSKFEEIIEFAGIAKYIDTPVKRYSSGMYVRLGFAVAAHLEPEILVVDEVLAVGDYEFQKKAIGKMQDVAKAGRTVLFVSHSMDSVSKLCSSAVIMQNGKLVFQGDTQKAIALYMENSFSKGFKANQKSKIYIEKIQLLNQENQATKVFDYKDQIHIQTKIKVNQWEKNVWFGYNVMNERGVVIFTARFDLGQFYNKKDEIELVSIIPNKLLISSKYSVLAAIYVPNQYNLDTQEGVLSFEVLDTSAEWESYNLNNGCVFVPTEWQILSK